MPTQRQKTVAHALGTSLASILLAQLGPIGGYASIILGQVLGDMFPEGIQMLLEKVGEIKIKNAETKQEVLGLMMEALKKTLEDLKKEYKRELKLKKEEWFDCIKRKLENMPLEKSFKIPSSPVKVKEKDVIEFLFSFDCELDEKKRKELEKFLQERLPDLLNKNIVKVANMNTYLILELYTVFLESLTEHEKRIEELEKFIEGLGRLSKDEIEGIDIAVNEWLDMFLKEPFVGRDEILEKINNLISNDRSGKVIITGSAGVGKSTLMAHIVDMLSAREDVIVIPYYFSVSDESRRKFSTALRYTIAKLYLFSMGVELDKDFPFIENVGRLADILRKRISKIPKKKVVIIFDALDEADPQKANVYPFPQNLPENVYLIFSVRESQNNLEIPTTRELLNKWKENAEIIELENLGYNAVKSLVKESLSLNGQDLEKVSRTIYERTLGHPLYLKFLLTELKEMGAKNTEELLERAKSVPNSFNKYIQEQLTRIGELINEKNSINKTPIYDRSLTYNTLALLAIAKEPLGLKDIENIVDTQLIDLKTKIPHEAKRWLHIKESGGTEYWSFQHAALRENVFEVLRKDILKVQEKLLVFCSKNWKKNEYCLKYYPEHLYDAGRYDELFELVRNEEFLNAQRRLTGGTILGLKTVELAINAATNAKDLARLFEFAFLYNRIYNEANRLSLLEHYKRYGLEATLNIIRKNSDPEIRLKMLLILVAYLLAVQQKNDAKEALKRGIDISLPDVSVIQILLNSLEEYDNGKIIIGITKWFYGGEEEFKRWLNVHLGTNKDQIEKRQYQETALGSPSETSVEVDELETTLGTLMKTPDSSGKIFKLGNIAKSLAKRGKLEKALEVSELIQNETYRSRILGEIAEILAEKGESEKALEITRQVKNPYNRSRALIRIGDLFNSKGELEKSLDVLEQALEFAKQIEEDYNRKEILNYIIKSFAKNGELRKALELNKMMGGQYTKTELVEEAINTLVELGKPERAVNVIDKEFGPSSSRKLVCDPILTLKELAEALVRICELKRALNVISEIEDPYGRLLALGDLSTNLAKEGEVEKALEVSKFIQNKTYRSRILGEIAEILAEKGELEKALEIIKQMEYTKGLSPVFGEFVKMFYTNTNKSGDIFERSIEAINKISNARITSRVLVWISRSLARAGKSELAITTLEKDLTIVSQVLSRFHQSIVLTEIAEVFITLGDIKRAIEVLEQALNITEQIADLAYLSRALIKISKIFAKTGELERALEIIEQIADISYRSEALSEISKALAERGELENALKITKQIPLAHMKVRTLVEIVTVSRNMFLSSFISLQNFLMAVITLPEDCFLLLIAAYINESTPKEAVDIFLREAERILNIKIS